MPMMRNSSTTGTPNFPDAPLSSTLTAISTPMVSSRTAVGIGSIGIMSQNGARRAPLGVLLGLSLPLYSSDARRVRVGQCDGSADDVEKDVLLFLELGELAAERAVVGEQLEERSDHRPAGDEGHDRQRHHPTASAACRCPPSSRRSRRW